MLDHAETRTLIVHTNGILGNRLRTMLESDDAVEIVGVESNLQNALAVIRPLDPDLILVEVVGEQDGTVAQQFLQQMGPSGRVITVSAEHSNATVFEKARPGVVTPVESIGNLLELITKRHCQQDV